MSIQLHPFELYILRQFSNQSWYYPNIMNWLLSQNYNPQSSDYAIYALRSKGFLDTYYDNTGQYFAISLSGRSILLGQSSPFVDYNPRIDNPHIPTPSELQSIRLTQELDNELKRKTVENFDLQKENFNLQKLSFDSQKGKTEFDKVMTIISVSFAFISLAISTVTALSSNYEIMYKIVKNTITNEKQIPVIKPIKK